MDTRWKQVSVCVFLFYLFARPVAGDVVHISRAISTMIDADGAATVTTLMHRIEVVGWLQCSGVQWCIV